MIHDREQLNRELDGIERMLKRCEATRKQRRPKSDYFYQQLQLLQKMQKERRAILGMSDAEDNRPKH